MAMTPTQLYDEFMRLAGAGDEAAAEKFLNDHLAEFPEETQNRIISGYLKDAILQEAEGERARVQAEDNVLRSREEAKSARKEVANQQRIAELKEQLRPK